MVFLVPALPLRYGLTFGAAPAATSAGGVVIAAAVWRGWDRRLTGSLLLVGGAGALAGVAGFFAVPGLILEARLLAAVVAAVLAGAGVCRVVDTVVPPLR